MKCFQRLTPLLLVAVSVLFLAAGCSQDTSQAAIETDAHGYSCQQCGAKLYTGAREFLESKCPKCQQETLIDVTGYWCEKDKHLTIRPNIRGTGNTAVCEKCGMTLKNAMVSPKEKDLVAWGAVKTTAPKAH